MAQKTAYDRLPWQDRFNTPTARQLRDGIPGPMKTVFDRVRKRLLAVGDVSEHFVWYGESWAWTIEFRLATADDPLAVLIPCPTDLQMGVPMDREFTRSLPVKRMKRAVRDGLELAQDPFDTHWGVWSVPAAGLIDDLQDLVERKLRHLGKVG